MSDGCCSDNNCCGTEDLKSYVKNTYARTAKQLRSGKTSCCGCGTDCNPISANLYSQEELENIPDELLSVSLGCANPTALAELKPGETVLDLGSGGGLDVLLAAKRVAPDGKVYGLDMTEEMLELARENQRKAGIKNAEFLKGDIENIPLPDASVDVIISNCVINLSTDKNRVFSEAYRVLRPGGRLAVADIVLRKPLSPKLKQHLPLWAGCISGALEIKECESKLRNTGFVEPEIQIVREYSNEEVREMIPDDIAEDVTEQEILELAQSLASAFIRARKPC